MPRRTKRKIKRYGGPPFTRPCTFPLHVRQKYEPLWITMDYKQIGWCPECRVLQKALSRRARRSFWYNYQRPQYGPDDPQRHPRQPLTYKRVRMARKFAPTGMMWCSWGYHYDDPEQFTKGKSSICKPCGNHSVRLRSILVRREAYNTWAILRDEIKRFRARRAELVQQIKDEEQRLKALQEICYIEPPTPAVAQLEESIGVQKPIDRIKIVTLAPPPHQAWPKNGQRITARKNVARSYS